MNNGKVQEAVNVVFDIKKKQNECDELVKQLTKLKRSYSISKKEIIKNYYNANSIFETLKLSQEEKIIAWKNCLIASPELAVECLMNQRGFIHNNTLHCNSPHDIYREAALSCIMNNPETIFELIESSNVFEDNDLKEIYLKHHEFFYQELKKSFKRCLNFCETFSEFIGFEEKALLVKKIISCKQEYVALSIVNNTSIIQFPENLKDQLNAFLVAQKLMRH